MIENAYSACRGWFRLAQVVVLGGMLTACDGYMPDTGIEIGDPLPPLQIQALDGTSTRLDDLHGKVVVLNIWAVWCRPCREEMPSLERLAAQLDPDRFRIIGVSVDDDRYLVQEFLRRHSITFPVFLDPEQRGVKQLGVNIYPETFLLAADSTVQARISGAYTWDTPAIRNLLEHLFQNGSVTDQQVRQALNQSP